MDRVTKRQCLNFSYTFEFQKRGWPHCHILLWLDERDMHLEDPAGIDSVVKHFRHVWHASQMLLQIQSCLISLRNFTFILREVRNRHVGDVIENAINNFLCERKSDLPSPKGWSCDLVSQWPNCYVVPYNPTLLREYQCHI